MVHTSVLAGAPRTPPMRRREANARCPSIRPRSKVTVSFLTMMMKHGHAGKFEIIDDHQAVKIVENLTGRLPKCGVTSPRFDVQLKDLEKWQNDLLPSRQSGFIVPTTSVGIMDHEEAR